MEPIRMDNRYPPHAIPWPNEKVWYGVGNGWEKYAAELSFSPAKIYADRIPRSQEVAQLALRDFLLGKAVSAKEALPVYLYPESCWKS